MLADRQTLSTKEHCTCVFIIVIIIVVVTCDCVIAFNQIQQIITFVVMIILL